MIEYKLRLSKLEDLKHAMFLTDLTIIQIEAIVGRTKNKLRGEAIVYQDGSVVIRDLKTKKVLWRL